MAKSIPPEIDIKRGIIPITKAAASLGDIAKRVKEEKLPFLITQKGYPIMVFLDVEAYADMRELALQALEKERQEIEPD